MKKLLYYPTILIPSHWLKKAVLFSDEISSIYPYEFTTRNRVYENQCKAEIEYLLSEGIYSYSRPEDLSTEIYQRILRNLESAYDEFKLDEHRKNFLSDDIKYEIYTSKLDQNIIRYLLDNKVAKKSHIGNSILVEKDVALKYMSLLASYSANSMGNFSISTDTMINKGRLYEDNELLAQEDFLEIIVKKIPQPSENNSIEDIIRFKESHREDLLNYRVFLHGWIHRLKQDATTASLSAFDDEIEKYNLEIKRMAKHSKFKFDFNFLEILAPVLTSNAAVYACGELTTGTGISSMVSTATAVFLKKFNPVIPGNSPVNFLIKAKREEII